MNEFLNGPNELIKAEKEELFFKLSELQRVRAEQGRIIDALQGQNLELRQCCDSHALLAANKDKRLKKLYSVLHHVRLVADIPSSSFISMDSLLRQIKEVRSTAEKYLREYGQL